GECEEMGKTMWGPPRGTCGRGRTNTAIAAGLIRADDVPAPIFAEGVHLLRRPLVVPEERADNPDLRIGETELIVADVQDHQPVRTCTECSVAHVAELAGLPRVQPRPVLIEPHAVGPAITQELPGSCFGLDWSDTSTT